MTIINTSPDRIIQIGYEGEDRVTVLRFRYGADWLENGEGIFHIRVRRHGESQAYNAQLVADDAENNCLLMTVTNTELSVKGSGEMQVVYSGEDFVKKSPIYSYNVSRAVDEAVDPPAQDVYSESIESLSDLQTDVSGITGDIGRIDGSIGTLAELTTTDKDSLVSAINEVNAKSVDITVDDVLSATSTNPVQNKVLTARINGLDSDVGTLRTSVQSKADTQTVSALSDAVQDLDWDVQGLQTTVQSKADTATVTALSGTVNTLQSDVSELQTDKANQSDFDDLSGNVATLWQTASQYMTQTETALTGLQTSKADKSYMDTQLATKASAQTVSDLADDVSDLQTGLAGKIEIPHTDEAKIAIQKMLGIYEAPWELIEDFTLAEAGMPDKSVEPDGTPYNFRQVFIKVIYPANLESAPSGYGLYYFYDEDNNNLLAETGKYTQNTAQMFKHIFLQKNVNMTTLMYTRITSVGSYAMLYNKSQGVGVTFGNVSRIRVNGTEPAGTQIQIYAQRAY